MLRVDSDNWKISYLIGVKNCKENEIRPDKKRNKSSVRTRRLSEED